MQENNVSKEILDASKNHYDDDSEIKSALRRMCTPLPKECSLGTDVLKDILQFYLSRLNEMECRDADELAVSMQILADDLFDEFGYEAEEIEYASVNSDPRV